MCSVERPVGKAPHLTLHLLVEKDPHEGPWQAFLMLLERGGWGGQPPASTRLALSERGLRQLAINFMHIINLSAFWRVGQIAHKVPLLSLAHGWAGEAEAHPARQTSARLRETRVTCPRRKSGSNGRSLRGLAPLVAAGRADRARIPGLPDSWTTE